MRVEFVGAVGGDVTGSRHIVHTEKARLLLDCGLFQGRRAETIERNQDLGFRASDIDVMVLSHAHIDHSGALPRLYRQGFRGPIYCTPATRDLCAAMLEDSAEIQAQDAAYINRKIAATARTCCPSSRSTIRRTSSERSSSWSAFHITGPCRSPRESRSPTTTLATCSGARWSRSTSTWWATSAASCSRVISVAATCRSFATRRFPRVRLACCMESTYGDRIHDPIERMEDELCDVITRTVERGGKVIVPSFALERAQEVVYGLKQLADQGRLPDVPVYVDSPLTVKLTDVFRIHPECFDEETRKILMSGDSPFDFDRLRYVSSVEDSKAIDRSDEPAVIISASGMCEFGRVVHHLVAAIENRKNTVLIVGYPGPAHARAPARRTAAAGAHLWRRTGAASGGRGAQRVQRARGPRRPDRVRGGGSRGRAASARRLGSRRGGGAQNPEGAARRTWIPERVDAVARRPTRDLAPEPQCLT